MKPFAVIFLLAILALCIQSCVASENYPCSCPGYPADNRIRIHFVNTSAYELHGINVTVAKSDSPSIFEILWRTFLFQPAYYPVMGTERTYQTDSRGDIELYVADHEESLIYPDGWGGRNVHISGDESYYVIYDFPR